MSAHACGLMTLAERDPFRREKTQNGITHNQPGQ